MCQINSRSIRNKNLQIDAFLSNLNPALVSINEHWCDDSEIECFHLENYYLCNYYSRSHFRGGGVALFARSDFGARPVSFNLQNTEQIFEYTACRFELNNAAAIFLSLYRSPGHNMLNLSLYLKRLEMLIQLAFGMAPFVFLGADFNIDQLSNTTEKKP